MFITRSLAVLFITGLASGQSDYANDQTSPGQQCSFPSVLPQYSLTPEKQDGAHYGYLVLQNTSVRTNPVSYCTKIGNSRTLLPATVIAAGASNYTGYYYSTPDSNSPCQAQYGPYYIGVDGRFQGYVYDSGAGNAVVLSNLNYYLFDDYVTVEIYLTCGAINSRTGKCISPDLSINTRTRPDKLSADAKARVDKIIDDTLKPYGCGRAGLPEHQWTTAKPLCSSPPPPACYLTMEKAIMDAINSGQFVDQGN